MNSGKYTVDRFEGEQAVLLYREDEYIQWIEKKSTLPDGIKEGDILFLEFNADGKLVNAKILEEETERARQKARELMRKLKNK